jgi:hypothetical protein
VNFTNKSVWNIGRKLLSVKGAQSDADKCAIDHILDAQKKGEINEDNVLYIIENINVAGKCCKHENAFRCQSRSSFPANLGGRSL